VQVSDIGNGVIFSIINLTLRNAEYSMVEYYISFSSLEGVMNYVRLVVYK